MVRWLQQRAGAASNPIHARKSANGPTLCDRTFWTVTKSWRDDDRKVTCAKCRAKLPSN